MRVVSRASHQHSSDVVSSGVSPEDLFLLQPSTATLKALYALPLRSLRQTDVIRSGEMRKRGELRRSWKQRYFVLHAPSSSLLYFAKHSDRETALGFIPLWLAQLSEASVARRSARDAPVLALAQPFGRTYYVEFPDAQSRQLWKADMLAVVRNAKEALMRNAAAWWDGWFEDVEGSAAGGAAGVDSGGDGGEEGGVGAKRRKRVQWRKFWGAVCATTQGGTDLQKEGRLKYILSSLKLHGDSERVSFQQYVTFLGLFGDPAEFLHRTGGVMRFFCAEASAATASSYLRDAAPGTFALYMASRPSDVFGAVLGLAYITPRGKGMRTQIFRDPNHFLFFTDFDSKAFADLDNLVAATIGTKKIYGRPSQHQDAFLLATMDAAIKQQDDEATVRRPEDLPDGHPEKPPALGRGSRVKEMQAEAPPAQGMGSPVFTKLLRSIDSLLDVNVASPSAKASSPIGRAAALGELEDFEDDVALASRLEDNDSSSEEEYVHGEEDDNAPQAERPFCAHCGGDLGSQARFCEKCGAAVNMDSQKAREMARKRGETDHLMQFVKKERKKK